MMTIQQTIVDDDMRQRVAAFASELANARRELVTLAAQAAGTHAVWHEHDFDFLLKSVKALDGRWCAPAGMVYRSRGTVLLGLSHNEPLIVGAVPLLAALVTHNRVLVRASTNNRRFMTRLAAVFRAARLDAFELLECSTDELDGPIAQADFVVWLGSERVCRDIGTRCARHGTPYLLESEGNDWAIFLEGLDATSISQHLGKVLESVVRHGGQTCQAIRGILVPEPLRGTYERALQLWLDQRRFVADKPEVVWIDSSDEEVTSPKFGPRLLAATYSSVQRAVQTLQRANYGLSLAIYCPDGSEPHTKELIENVPTARVSINVDSAAAEPCDPWGGIGRSGDWGVDYWPLKFVTRCHVRRATPAPPADNRVFSGRNAPIPFGSAYPSSVSRCRGPYVFAESGEPNIDLWMGFGAQLFGHGDSRVATVVQEAALDGAVHSYASPWEARLAERLHRTIPCAESMRYALTGQEATMYAVRIARAFTGRSRLIVARGAYHGANDVLSYRAIQGIPPTLQAELSFVDFNDKDQVRSLCQGREHAAVILEPVLGNATCIHPSAGYLEAVREACTASGTVLIFDEVMTGFRKHLGGAQGEFGVTPDLAVFGKALAGGMPLSVICGREEVLAALYPVGEVAMEGTFYGNPLGLRAALHVHERLENEGVLDKISVLADQVLEPVRQYVRRRDVPICVASFGGMFSIHFGSAQIESAAEQRGTFNGRAFTCFTEHLAARQILYPPIATEAAFFCEAHADVKERLADGLLEAVEKAAACL
jgi:glutamate-1-semialdehyde 2,1-aminomutase